jgi:hypothetical protein
LVSKSLLNRSDRRTGISIGSNLAVETQAEIAEIRGRDPGGGGRGVGDPVVREKNMAVERQMGDGLGARGEADERGLLGNDGRSDRGKPTTGIGLRTETGRVLGSKHVVFVFSKYSHHHEINMRSVKYAEQLFQQDSKRVFR